MKNWHNLNIWIYPRSTSLYTQVIEPPYTGPYVRWCERVGRTKVMVCPLYSIWRAEFFKALDLQVILKCFFKIISNLSNTKVIICDISKFFRIKEYKVVT